MKKVVSATLAGALAVGMVPAMALADDAVELQTQNEQDAIANGDLILADGQKAGQEFVCGTVAPYLNVTGVKIADGVVKAPTKIYIFDVVTSGGADSNFDDALGNAYKYNKFTEINIDSLGAWSVVADGLDYKNLKPGKYAVGAFVGSERVLEAVPFTVVSKSISDASLYEPVAAPATETYADKTFVFNGSAFGPASQLNVALAGAEFTAYESTVNYFKSNNASLGTTAPAAAGSYIARIEGTGDYDGSFANIAYEIKPVYVEDITFVLTAQTSGGVTEPKIDYMIIDGKKVDNDTLEGCFDVAFSDLVVNGGKYTATITPNATKIAAQKWTGSILGTSKSVEFVRGEEKKDIAVTYANGFYTNGVFDVDGDSTTVVTPLAIDRTVEGYAEFNPALVSTSTTLDGAKAKFTLEYEKVSNGAWVASSLSELTGADAFGTFRVRAVIDSAAYGYKYYGASDWMEITTTNGTVAANGVTFVYDNGVAKNVVTGITAGTVQYDGTDLMEDIAITVKVGNKVLSSSDYAVKIVKAAVGTTPEKEVTEIVDAGTYTITLSSTKYVIDPAQATMQVVVDPMKVDLVMADAFNCSNVDCTEKATHGDYGVLYTGETINPIAKFTKKVGAKDVEVAVPADAVKVTVKSLKPEGKTNLVAASEVKDAGLYTLEIVDAKNGANPDNYQLNNGGTYYLHVSAKNVYADVPADAWYADAVLTVAQNKWITGYSSNGLFGPNDGMKRGDLAIVLARYLKTTGTMTTFPALDGVIVGDAIISVNTGFSDVKGGAYYARAIKAMNEAGIMTGYEDGTYGPEDLVTRQQLATILARVEASGLAEDGETLLASALAAYADADEVAGWAAAGVEWAVENEIMGVDTAFLNPTDVVTRAEVAAMLVRYDALA